MALINEDDAKEFKEHYKQYRKGWLRLHNKLLERNISGELTPREREVARLAAFGFSNAEIAERLHIEISSVKRYVFSAMNKVGAERRSELGLYI
ncbi:MAG: LuxR C-terminal-related transcriptional regulator [Clostridia bacterium]|nr:LuxR C-terminal-related transcriptional regulator [Clostridia bacterium]